MLWGSVADPRRARGLPLVFSAGPTAIISITSNCKLLQLLVVVLDSKVLGLGSGVTPYLRFWIRCHVGGIFGSCQIHNTNIR